ncbi:MAG: hypothetical protein K0R26_1286 [Bacteroidota bacterium]|nr:hypothetical protein [Bacteroidota bacterium]
MSFFQNISSWLISRKEPPKVEKQFLNWKQLSNVVVIAYDHQLSNCVDFINACQADNILVNVAVIFDGRPELAPKPSFTHLILDKKQFSFFGIPKPEALLKLNPKPIDVLINLGTSNQAKTYALAKFLPAKCKVGSFDDSIFDISIQCDVVKNCSEYLKQVIVYLKMIKPKTL